MKNPIIYCDFFTTPKTLDELMSIAESMTNSSEAYRMMVFTLNFCHAAVQEQLTVNNLSEETK
jgi:hypothetical protein